MRVLGVYNLPYFRTGGGVLTIRTIHEELARGGHEAVCICTMRALGLDGQETDTEDKSRAELRANGIACASDAREITFVHHGVTVHLVRSASDIPGRLASLRRSWEPDWVGILGPSTRTLSAAVMDQVPAERVIAKFLAVIGLPFGPSRVVDDPEHTALFRSARAALCPSEYVQRYLARWGSIESRVMHVPVYGAIPPAPCNDPQGPITIINLSPIKGSDIFVQLAERMPDLPFLAMSSWASDAETQRRLAALPNVKISPPVPHERMHDVYCSSRILLAPTIVPEAFGLVVVEAMLRGVPVLASDSGGLREAKLGVPHVLPVRAIDGVRAAALPMQDVSPWLEVVRRLCTHPDEYAALSELSHRTATAFVTGLCDRPYTSFLESLGPVPSRSAGH